MSTQDFERECNVWLSISQHKNIAHASAFGTWEGQPAILVDWYPQSMAELKVHECSDDYIIELARGLIAALDFAYRKANVIHRDIKLGNILIDRSGAARLSDFCLTRSVKIFDRYATYPYPKEITSLTLTPGAVAGTPFYMAPELLTGARLGKCFAALFLTGLPRGSVEAVKRNV